MSGVSLFLTLLNFQMSLAKYKQNERVVGPEQRVTRSRTGSLPRGIFKYKLEAMLDGTAGEGRGGASNRKIRRVKSRDISSCRRVESRDGLKEHGVKGETGSSSQRVGTAKGRDTTKSQADSSHKRVGKSKWRDATKTQPGSSSQRVRTTKGWDTTKPQPSSTCRAVPNDEAFQPIHAVTRAPRSPFCSTPPKPVDSCCGTPADPFLGVETAVCCGTREALVAGPFLDPALDPLPDPFLDLLPDPFLEQPDRYDIFCSDPPSITVSSPEASEFDLPDPFFFSDHAAQTELCESSLDTVALGLSSLQVLDESSLRDMDGLALTWSMTNVCTPHTRTAPNSFTRLAHALRRPQAAACEDEPTGEDDQACTEVLDLLDERMFQGWVGWYIYVWRLFTSLSKSTDFFRSISRTTDFPQTPDFHSFQPRCHLRENYPVLTAAFLTSFPVPVVYFIQAGLGRWLLTHHTEFICHGSFWQVSQLLQDY